MKIVSIVSSMFILGCRSSEIRKLLLAAFICVGLMCSGANLAGQQETLGARHNGAVKRPVTVADVIQMTQIGDEDYDGGSSFKHRVAKFSPDRTRFVILVREGNVKLNTNRYSLLLFRSNNPHEASQRKVLASLSSSSNRPAIRAVEWIDNNTLGFLGEHPGEKQQLYTVDCGSGRLRKVTDHPTNLVSYALSAKDGGIYFTAEEAATNFLDENTRRTGIVVGTQFLPDLISGRDFWLSQQHEELFVQRSGDRQPVRINAGQISGSHLWLSPNGRHLLTRIFAPQIPDLWKQYKDPRLWLFIADQGQHDAKDNVRYVFEYELIDTTTGGAQILLDAPIGHGHSEVAWSADSHSVVISGTYLPTDVPDPAERTLRERNRFVAEVMVPSGEIVPICHEELKLHGWDAQLNRLLFESTVQLSYLDVAGRPVAYQKTQAGWMKISASAADLLTSEQVDVTLEEDMNTPPRVFLRDRKSGQTAVLFDLNPRFEELLFGRVQELSFKATDGHEVKAGLYLPPGYVPGKRYPLVIQTHGWNPDSFCIDGPYPTAFAAQPLASKGIVVAQLEEDPAYVVKPDELRHEQSAYEGAIDYLDAKGIIDRDRVGIIGFSRTGLSVKYALTHSSYHFTAATIADGSDGGYYNYLTVLNWSPAAAKADSEGIFGATPFGAGMATWLRNSPGFALDKVAAAIRLEANHPASLLFTWEWFAGLRRLGKAVDLIYMPEADHVLVKPWDRIISQGGNVDWFCFWLKGEEDSDPSKAEQYSRWGALKKLEVRAEPLR